MVSAFSFGTSQRSQPKKSSEEAPGPGEYQSQRHHNRRPPAWGFGSADRNKYKSKNTPGPGQYEDKEQTVKRAFPKYQFGIKIGQSEVGKGITPGPGTYDQESQPIYKASSQYSFGLKVPFGGVADKVRFVRDNPGPATYETNYSTLITRPSSKVGNQQRGDIYNESFKFTPGVGTYNVRPSTSGPQYRFGTGNREGQFIANQNPGPGTYTYNSTLRQTFSGKSIGGRHVIPPDDRFYVPGPGQYESFVELTKRFQPQIRIGTAKRRELNQNEKNVPGPGAYSSSNIDKKRPPSYKIGTQQKGLIQDSQTPGPGTYERPSEIGNGKAYSLRLKPQLKDNDETPGPQDYYPQLNQTNLRPASCKVGSESRDKFYNQGTMMNPGPDYYNLKSDSLGPKYGFGSEKRAIFKGEGIPGPGTYDIPPYFANVPSYLIPQTSTSQFNKTK